MSVRYRVACACGQSVLVGEAQAGSTTSCLCGAVVTIPMLRELRKLPQEESPTTTNRTTSQSAGSWNPRQSALFAAGAVTFMALLVAGILIAGRARLNASWTPELQRLVDDEFVDSIEPVQTLGAFYEMRANGLGDPQPTTVMLNRETYHRLGGLIKWVLAAAAAGAVAWLGVAFGWPKK